TTPGHSLGTPAYMAPEQLKARDADSELGPACDIYSLCATFYELFTRARLFNHDHEPIQRMQEQKLQGRPRRPRQIVPQLPWETAPILRGGLEPDVSDRYRSMAALERDVRHYLRDEPIEHRRPSVLRRLRLWYRRSPVVAWLVGSVAALLVLGIV